MKSWQIFLNSRKMPDKKYNYEVEKYHSSRYNEIKHWKYGFFRQMKRESYEDIRRTAGII